jgi:hypothetical protein
MRVDALDHDLASAQVCWTLAHLLWTHVGGCWALIFLFGAHTELYWTHMDVC